MLGGAIIVALSLLLLGWATEIAGLLVQDPSTVCILRLFVSQMLIFTEKNSDDNPSGVQHLRY